MKDYDQVYQLIRESHTVNATPRLIAEFNHNRYSQPTAINTPLSSENDADPDVYDIDSIVDGRRPSRGIVKARVGATKVSADYDITPQTSRYYVTSPDDVYKYWSSPQPTVGTTFAAGTDIYPTDVNPQVTYDAAVITNKIVIGFENSFSSPANWEIWVKDTTVSSWRLIKAIGTVYTPDNEGRVSLYWNGTEWNTTYDNSQYTTLAGVQLRVASMTVANTYLNLIELGLRLERDLSSFMTNVNDTFDLGEATDLNPIGSASSNVGSVTLFNHYDNGFMFNDENINNIFRGMMEENVMFTLDYIYKVNPGLSVPIRQFQMYSTAHWSANSQVSTEVQLRDSSKFLQETKSVAIFLEDKTVTGIIYRILDSVGFTNYDIGNLGKQLVAGVWVDIDTTTDAMTIPYFWSDSESMVWDTLQALCEGTQTAIWFDSNDRLQVRTRNQVFQEQGGKVWTLRGSTAGAELVDIISYGSSENNPSNDVTVNYQTTAFEEFVPGIRRNTIVWQPEDETVYTKASDIQANLMSSDMTIKFTPADAALWPFDGMIRIEAEQIAYKGKQYTYYPNPSNDPVIVTANPVTVWLESYDDYKKYHFDTTPIQNRYLNKYTGYLQVTERGMWNTPIQNHLVETASIYTQKNVLNSSAYADANGFFKSPRRLAIYRSRYSSARSKYLRNKRSGSAKKKYQAASATYKSYAALYSKYKNAALTDGVESASEKGTVQMKTNGNYPGNRYLMAVRGVYSDVGFKYYGTKLRFNKDSSLTGQSAGLLFQSNGSISEAGYRVQVDKKSGAGGIGRVSLYRMDNSGNATAIRSISKIILEDKWYSLDIMVSGNDASSSYIISIWLDGIMIISQSVTGSNKLNYYGRFGMFARGQTNVEFEYLYAIGEGDTSNWPANFAKYDRIAKGFSSSQFADFASSKTDVTTRRVYHKKLKTYYVKYTQFVFDEFGPIAHEIRKFDIKYDTSEMPVLAPYVYYTNTGRVDILDSNKTAFGSEIYMINTDRDDAALQGTDDNHQFCVYGLVLKQRDVQTVKSKNKASIAAIGSKELTVESKWIQTKDAAQSLADWITDHWSKATDSMTVTIFGNCLIEVGDVVALDIDIADIDETSHKYFVTSAQNSFSAGGLTTSLSLRRIKN